MRPAAHSRSIRRRARFGRVSSAPAPPASRTSAPPTQAQPTAKAALEAGGLARLRVLTVAMLLLVQVGIGAVAMFDAELTTKRIAWASLASLLGLFVYSYLRLEQSHEVDQKAVRQLALPMSLATVVANFAFGLVSVFCGAVTLGLVLFASAVSQRNARLTFTCLAVGYAGAALLARWGLLPYRPILPLSFERPWQWDLSVCAVLSMYFAAYVAGRMLRREMSKFVERYEAAVRDASYRNALLRESHAAFRQAAGLGAPGRYTDQEIDGFRLGEVIGRGALGEVYAARRGDEGPAVALKLLRLEALSDRATREQFEHAIARASAISSPHVVRVLACSAPGAMFPFVAMERLDGADLGSYLRERGRLSLDEVCDLARQLAAGLEAAHERRVLHRALKPSDVFRAISEDGPDPVWKLLDFGFSSLTRGEAAIQLMQELVGTPQYMAPEQARGDDEIDERADVYGLAAIAYRALTGEAPFSGELPTVLQHIAEDLPPLPSTRVALPPDVNLALALGLAKQPDDRLLSASGFAHALAAAARSELDEPLRERARNLLKQRHESAVRLG